jgi:hypothetical protein
MGMKTVFSFIVCLIALTLGTAMNAHAQKGTVAPMKDLSDIPIYCCQADPDGLCRIWCAATKLQRIIPEQAFSRMPNSSKLVQVLYTMPTSRSVGECARRRLALEPTYSSVL